jgi:hypothetical protein
MTNAARIIDHMSWIYPVAHGAELVLSVTLVLLSLYRLSLAIYLQLRMTWLTGGYPRGTRRRLWELDDKRAFGVPSAKGLGRRARPLISAVVYATIASVLFALGWVLHSALLLTLGATSLAILLVSCIAVTTPPAILFLSCSNREAYLLQERIDIIISPLQVVSLLHLNTIWGDISTGGMLLHSRIDHYSFRVRDVVEWRDVMDFLSKVVIAIVVNARESSPELHYEIGRLLTSQLLHKALFIVGPSGEHAALDAFKSQSLADSEQWRLVSEEELPARLTALLSGR